MQQQGATHNRTARDSVRNSSELTQTMSLTILKELIEEIVAVNKNQLESLKQEMSLIENESLHIHHRGSKIHFSCYDKKTKNRSSISNEHSHIYRLARRGYLDKRAKAINSISSRLTKVLDATEWAIHETRLNNELNRYARAKLDLTRILFTDEQNEWIDQPYSPNPFHPENLLYSTKGGTPMRSNPEVKIGNYLEMIGVPYRSDDLVTIQSTQAGERPFKGNYFADFKVPNLLGGITIHEHFGAFQIDNYADNALRRLHDYRSFQVFELPYRPVKAEEFTWSLQADIQDEALFRRVIRNMLFPL